MFRQEAMNALQDLNVSGSSPMTGQGHDQRIGVNPIIFR